MADGHAVLNVTAADECIIDQGWENYTREDHNTWGTLFNRQMKTLSGHVCAEYLEGLRVLGITADNVPDFEVMNRNLRKATGWEVVAVPGLIPSRPFFDMLSNRQFPAGNFIRKPEQLDYLEEPDIFHDVFGHIPLLTNPAYADYMHAYGCAGDNAIANKGVKYLARLNWWTIEFGLIKNQGDIKIFGAGICSSYGESRYVAEDPSAHFVQFDLERCMRTGYYIDDFQATYFVIDSFEDLFTQAVERPFLPLYEKFRSLPPLTPFVLEESDQVLRRGTGGYWKDFARTKEKLK
ncbi:MAG: phenylalanine 4-monooxygenase [Alphaproteobacteria bacterium]|nr:phenylalanine 4-monooxygenase [Alphaproteobacteria bacterium]